MKVGVCDFPGPYAFPPVGYGGIERWLWACALGADLSGASVTLLGLQWRPETEERFSRWKVRLEELDEKHWDTHQFDVLIAGHEYFASKRWLEAALAVSDCLVTYQHAHFHYPDGVFDGAAVRLFCFSPQMLCLYRRYRPRQCFSVGRGLQEPLLFSENPKDYALWMARIDRDKAPHYAIQAAIKIGLPIRVAGPILDESYYARHAQLFEHPYVTYMGDVGGEQKMELIANARLFIYTTSRSYVEPGALVFSEVIPCGVPIAAISWTGDDCSATALCPKTGSLFVPSDLYIEDNSVIDGLATACVKAMQLDRYTVRKLGHKRFDPHIHFQQLVKNRDNSGGEECPSTLLSKESGLPE
jgi:glycosyltransferase involved in cell wall biosynthesis